MLRKEITYTNPFTEQEVTEEHYFHISKADLVKMEMEEHGTEYQKDGQKLEGMQAKLTRIADSQDGKAIIQEFEDIIRRAYGKKEGERFLKSKEISDDFLASEAYSQLLFELCTKADAAAEFVNGVIPSNLDQIAREVREEAEKATTTEKMRTLQEEQRAERAKTASAGTAQVADELASTATSDNPPERKQEIENATSENPVTLTEAEIREMDSETFRSGIADGRYKIS